MDHRESRISSTEDIARLTSIARQASGKTPDQQRRIRARQSVIDNHQQNSIADAGDKSGDDRQDNHCRRQAQRKEMSFMASCGMLRWFREAVVSDDLRGQASDGRKTREGSNHYLRDSTNRGA